jgi:RHS repeat-associated protein
VDTSYDALGRVYSVSNPHRSTSSPTDGTTYYSYDALGRLTRATNPDTNYKTFSYTNRAMEFTDEASIQKVYQSDGLGRLVKVCDGVGAGTQANGSPAGDPASCGLDISANGFLATYGYDALGNITSVNLPGQLLRQFTYDGLSRMLTEDVPEINFVKCGVGGLTHSKCYTYDTVTAGDLSSSTFLKPNGTSVNAQYTWDALHRLTLLQYSDADGYGYTYDASTWQTWNLQNGKGRLTSQSHSNGAAAAYSYDAMGRPVWEGSCAGTNCYSTVRGMLHSYDYAGNVAIMTDSYGTSFTNTRNSIGQITKVQSSWNDTPHPGTLLNGATYNPLGELSTVTYGDGLSQTNSYDSLGRLTERQVGSSPTYRIFLTYNPNSTISEYQDNVTGRWDYTYDAFNRLATANLTQTGNNSPPHYTYSYDQYGNRWQQHLVSGTGNEVDYTFTANNKNTNFTYDYMGNVTADGVCSPTPCWSFDYAGHLTTGNGASYLYDGLGRRQQKTDVGGTVHNFVVDADGKPFDEYAPGLARVTGGFFDYEANKAEFNYLDHLGTPRLSTDYTGAVVRTEGVLMGPFGDNFTETNASLDFTGFAGGFWDTENNGEHFGAREYQNTHGSWLSPDPAGMAAVDPSNPQTWNRYAYVANNPVSFTDPLGLFRAFPGQCQGGQGLCADEGAGGAPVDNGGGVAYQIDGFSVSPSVFSGFLGTMGLSLGNPFSLMNIPAYGPPQLTATILGATQVGTMIDYGALSDEINVNSITYTPNQLELALTPGLQVGTLFDFMPGSTPLSTTPTTATTGAYRRPVSTISPVTPRPALNFGQIASWCQIATFLSGGGSAWGTPANPSPTYVSIYDQYGRLTGSVPLDGVSASQGGAAAGGAAIVGSWASCIGGAANIQ